MQRVFLSKFIANIRRDDAESYCSSIDFDIYTGGSTNVPIEAAMTMQHEIDEKETNFIWDQRGDDLPELVTS
eukprot:11328217-Ditylum_brightwellii.AAC.1